MALTVFFFPYALFEVPSDIVLKLMRPSHWLTLLIVAWGTVVTLQGIVRSYEHLIVARVLIGVTEAGFFPAATYLSTTWYCRWELQTRMAIFFSAASLAGGFSGLLAFGIQHLDGVGGLSGWRWIFIIEGILTVLVGVFIAWILPDGPRSASFLTAEEKCFLFARMQHEIGLSDGEGDNHDQKFDWKFLWSAMADWKIYLAVIIYWGNSISVYGFSFAAPTIIRELGYTSAQAQLLTIPIYLFGACSTIFFARLADRRKTRWVFIVIPFCIALVGYVGGLYPSIIGCISWVGNNLAPYFKRAIGMALLMTVGNLGGAVGSNIFVEDQAPQYWLGYGLSAGIILAAIISTVILQVSLKCINAKRAEMSEVDVCNRFTAGPLYYNSDVVARLDGIEILQSGKGRVLVTGVKGIKPPPTTKVGIAAKGGYQAEGHYFLVGLDIEEKAHMVETQVRHLLYESRFHCLKFRINGRCPEDPRSQDAATIDLRISAQARNEEDLALGNFFRPVSDVKMQGYPGATFGVDARQAQPKPYYE
ncbi:inner membrane transport protein yfaV [Verticillium alfalfae VaMs.102]|uniref:Inner membrane transport protein yfaV n=1 Tax=Verticillium alfalfae (strain VaMs.102 / ATCC MYA-4576 / FGSC 10136) TaxID=526221 RepID=C9SMR6_VERA1|nr:inner membrane transport protein yfaV [Verticillium alfalfae VaMs.102]EEY20081.1 inner membrane transport protein yfaV [Verticillium alfalfae VaMs.102]